MAARRTPGERGPLGHWATSTRELLSLSAEQVAQASGLDYSTYRKVEGGSNRNPSRRAVFEMWRLFRESGRQQGIPVEEPPGYDVTTAAPMAAPGESALVAALTRQAEAMEALTAVLAVREGISPSDLPLGVGELAARLLGEQDARRERESRRQVGGA